MLTQFDCNLCFRMEDSGISEVVHDAPLKRKRQKKFSKDELHTLATEVRANKDLLFAKQSDVAS